MDDEVLLQRLSEEIRNISSTLDQAIAKGHIMNEAQTERLVIEPLLNVLGYDQLDIVQRDHDNVAKNFPDYTLLSGRSQKWFLEAKKLDHHLQDGEAAQAVNYANNQGAEWAVLTNGRKWFLYNAHLPKPLAEKRVFVIDDLFDTDHSLPILKLLTKDAMLKGSLASAWKRHQVVTLTRRQIETPNSSVRKLLRRLASEETKSPVDDAFIGDVLSSFCALQPAKSVSPADESPPVLPAPSMTAGEDTWYTFGQLATDSALGTNRKPAELHFTDGEMIAVSSWADAAKVVVEKAGQKRGLPQLPFAATKKGKNYFLNTTPHHSNGGEMRHYREAQINDAPVFIDTNRSVHDISRCIVAFLQAVGAPVDAVRVRIE